MASLISYLSDDERAYLRHLFAESAGAASSDAERGEALRLEAPALEQGLLARLLMRLDSELVVSDGHYSLRFPIEVSPCPFGGPPRLRLAPPLVTDVRGAARCARVRPWPDEIGVDDPHGVLRGARVVDISTSGMSVEAPLPVAARPGETLSSLGLRLPRRQCVTFDGRVVRVEPRRLALWFEGMPSEAQAALRAYVFDRYALRG